MVALLDEVAAGQPVLVLQNLSLPMAPQWHYAVVVGYDRAAQTVLLHSGTTPRLALPLATFEHTWARSGRWAVRVTAPDRLPVTAEPDTWAAAVAPLERVNPAAAAEAWRTALRRWPDHRISLLGLGNAAYAQGHLTQAAAAYGAAARAHADFADAWNNLAQVRLELGDRSGATEAIARAVALGGPRLADYQQLQRRIGGSGR
jgi:tetratricopeptide (TPR) repeat protein